MSIYGPYEGTLDNILLDVEKRIRQLNQQEVASQQPKLYEHLIGRVKTPLNITNKITNNPNSYSIFALS